MSSAMSLKSALEKSLEQSFGNTNLGLNLVNESAKLIYDIPDSTRAIFHDRRELIVSSDKSSYAPSETIVIKLNSTNDLLDCGNSYLKFRLNTAAALDRLCGPATNLIRKIKIYCSSGTIEEMDYADIVYKLMHEAGSSTTWLETHGQAIGYYPGYRQEVSSAGAVLSISAANAAVNVRDTRFLRCDADLTNPVVTSAPVLLGNQWDTANSPAGAGNRTYMIPLHISGFLSQSKLIPLQLFKDLTIEITLNTSFAALCNQTNNVGAYGVSKVNFVAEVVRVNDIWAAQLQLASEEKDPRMQLKMVFPSISTQTASVLNTATTSDIMIQPNYFDVRAIYVLPRLNTARDGDGKSYGHLSRQASLAVTQYNWQVGQNFYPNQDVQDNLHSYAEALESFNRLKHVDNACLSYNDYLNYCYFIGVNLETDADSNLTGQPIGPSNPAVLHIKSMTATGDQTLHINVLHTRMLIVQGGGRIVINV